METEPETRLIRPGDEIRRMNGHVMELMSLLLNLAPDVITPEMVRSLAAETGFCHAAHLANAFHRAFGLSPGRFRARGS